MIDIKDFIISNILDILKKREIKNEIKSIITPLTSIILETIYPYILIIILFSFLTFFIMIANLILLIMKL